jgi:hypothetical protein
MNQVLKSVVYGKGTRKQAEFMADIGGMNDEERQMFLLIHDGESEIGIQAEMGLSRKSYERIEELVRAKLSLAVFECINAYMINKDI